MSKIHEYGNYGVDVGVKHRSTTPDIFWSKGGNTFVIVRGNDRSTMELHGTPVDLVSINGIGEVRWDVSRQDIERAAGSTSGHLREGLDAFNHFKLSLRHRQKLEENPNVGVWWLVGGVVALGALVLMKKKPASTTTTPTLGPPPRSAPSPAVESFTPAAFNSLSPGIKTDATCAQGCQEMFGTNAGNPNAAFLNKCLMGCQGILVGEGLADV